MKLIDPVTESWQRILKARGYYKGLVDGVLGSYTLQATKLYQAVLRQSGLYRGDIDGLAGSQTWDAHRLYNGGSAGAKGVERTDWREYRAERTELLAGHIPDAAMRLLASFHRHASTHNLSVLFLLAISKHETAIWTSNAFRNRNNAMGISNPASVRTMPSHDESIRIAAFSLGRPNGFYRNCRTLADVGAIYAPPGAANDPKNQNGYWPGLVARYWAGFESTIAQAERGAA